MPSQTIILFDGVCNFCNTAVNFVIKRDKKSVLKFAPLQSEFAKRILINHHLSAEDLSTFLFIENNKIYTKSTAALKVCKYLKGLWSLLYGLIIVPEFIRNGIYNWIAKNRYQWFGKKEVCMIPSADVRSRFLNDAI
jgi:predicted DCC family thiol-disulfide oxidoreductase YuxK